MTDTFMLKLALSFLIGGLWVSAASVAAERLGSKIGGVIGGLPSTAVVAYGVSMVSAYGTYTFIKAYVR